MKVDKRPDWHQYFMEIVELVSKRSTCLRRKVGAIIVKDNRILATGYNGAPKKIEHCSKVGCLRKELNIPSGERHEICRGTHAEQNAIIQAAYYGVSIKDASLYCTNTPCVICSKMLINAGIKKVYYKDKYPDQMAEEFLLAASIPLQQILKITK